MDWFIDWLFGGNGLFIKILKLLFIVYFCIPAIAGGIFTANWLCFRLKRFLGGLSHYLRTEKQSVGNIVLIFFIMITFTICSMIVTFSKDFRRGVYPEFLALKIRVSVVEAEVNKQLRRIDEFLIQYDKNNHKKWWQVWR